MAKAIAEQVPVTMRALLQRINRRLAHNDEKVKALRGDRWRHELGDYYRIDLRVNGIIDKHVDLEALGRELKVLAPYERAEEDEV
jgi:hypothetical protein